MPINPAPMQLQVHAFCITYFYSVYWHRYHPASHFGDGLRQYLILYLDAGTLFFACIASVELSSGIPNIMEKADSEFVYSCKATKELTDAIMTHCSSYEGEATVIEKV